jgi:hypothetical protein
VLGRCTGPVCILDWYLFRICWSRKVGVRYKLIEGSRVRITCFVPNDVDMQNVWDEVTVVEFEVGTEEPTKPEQLVNRGPVHLMTYANASLHLITATLPIAKLHPACLDSGGNYWNEEFFCSVMSKLSRHCTCMAFDNEGTLQVLGMSTLSAEPAGVTRLWATKHC